MSRQRLVERITADLAIVRHELDPDQPGPARTKLDEWAGGYPAQTHGAAPPTTRSEPSYQPGELDDGPIHTVDFARRHLADLDRICEQLEAQARDVLGCPTTATRRQVILAAFGHCHARMNTEALTRASRGLSAAATIIATTTPAQPNTAGQTCHAHAAAGDPHEPTAPEYRELCRWCGRFKAMHGVHPPAEIVKRHARGARISRDDLYRAGIKQAVSG